MAGKSVGVLGGGIGGLIAANVLRKLLPRSSPVVLVDRSPDHFFPPSYLWAATGDRGLDGMHRPLDRLLRKGVDVVTGEIDSIRPAHRAVTVGDDRYEFDYLLVALGADMALDTTPGLAEAHTFYSFGGTSRLRQALASFAGGPILVVVSDAPFKYPAAAYEAAMLIDGLLRRRGLREGSPIELVTVEARPFPDSGPAVGDAIAKMLTDRGITYTTELKLLAVDHKRCLATFSDTSQRPFELIVMAPSVRAPAVVLLSGLASETGWISTGPATMSTMFEHIYAIGDVCSVRLPNKTYLPKAGLFAAAQATVAAANIADAILGRPETNRYSGSAKLFLETGGGKAARVGGNFYAKPEPKVKISKPTRLSHWMKVYSEMRWWSTWL